MFRGLLVLISFFTRIPIGKKIEFNEAEYKKALCLYAFIGLIIGLVLTIGYFIGDFLEIIYIKGLIITAIYIIITGGIHLDGASDTVDGLFSGRTGDRIFEIMSDSRIGAFGVISLILILYCQLIFFSNVSIYTLILTPVVGKVSVVVSCYKKKYAKKSLGMGTIFVESIKLKELLINLGIILILCVVLKGCIINILSTVLTFIIVFFMSKWIENKIFGMTGDTCGFVAEISQIVFMFLSLIVGKVILL
ncbi:adenosylcobinamide-GDP ribazoletransferase [Sedimentibacter sp. zth1]|uniref:adenosylcobinamide-GDP ribazoletransferase n=1 Tax=Sedimentibacter sp. zth1 TaxID=2816908 RepID=UPI001A933A4F|nr:adenosylcobinamide-GDP ribazoletransferase [Sedimentibacter sp. zth1]QSX06602.1 adenosylcobinamide-GDP ribazoletransferase [Sedimentibacter sp. zth1]